MKKTMSMKIVFKPRSYILWLFVAVAALSFLPAAAKADTPPVVTSFTVSPSYVPHDYSVLLSWSVANAYGQSLTVYCPDGVTVNSSTGASFPCNAETAIGGVSSTGSAVLSFSNVSGAAKTLSLHLTPKDVTGADNNAGAADASVTVGTAPQPLTGMTFSTSTVIAGSQFTVSWTGNYVPGVNIQFGCVSGLQITAVSPAGSGYLPCGSPAFSTDLPLNSGATFVVTSTLSGTVNLPVTVLPSIVAGSYDATHALTQNLPIAPTPPPAPPSAGSFSATPSRVESGESVMFSWLTANAAGANVRIACQQNVAASAFVSGSTTTLPCAVPAFDPPLSATGSTTVTFTNTGFNWQNVLVTLLPENSDGTYNGINAPTVTVTVTPPGAAIPATTATAVTTAPAANASTASSIPTAPVVTSGPTAPSAGQIKAVRTLVFTAALARGSRNAQVTALQQFLALDPTLYPEGLVTGYFGPATLAAVERFQVRYGIAAAGDAGYGLVGPKTRAKINSLQYF